MYGYSVGADYLRIVPNPSDSCPGPIYNCPEGYVGLNKSSRISFCLRTVLKKIFRFFLALSCTILKANMIVFDSLPGRGYEQVQHPFTERSCRPGYNSCPIHGGCHRLVLYGHRASTVLSPLVVRGGVRS